MALGGGDARLTVFVAEIVNEDGGEGKQLKQLKQLMRNIVRGGE